MKILIVYHSRSGYTRRVAEQLATRLGATACAVTAPGLGPGLLGYQRCLVSTLSGRDVAIQVDLGDPAAFDLVVFGTPVWAWRLASPMRTLARRHAGAVRRCAFFCTSGGPVGVRPFTELARCLGLQPVATLALTDREIDSGTALPKIAAFAQALETGTGRPAPAVSGEGAQAAGQARA